jgi:hypothetical protein
VLCWIAFWGFCLELHCGWPNPLLLLLLLLELL